MADHVVVFGASGFVGRAVCVALERRGAIVDRRAAPRLTPMTMSLWQGAYIPDADVVSRLAERLPSGATVLNAAGLSDSGAPDEGALFAANAALPGLLAAAALQTRGRFVQVSSAAVQGRLPRLDSTDSVAPFSHYSRSKVAGEHAAAAANSRTVSYRPPGVHGPERGVTRAIARIARSRLSSTAAPGTANTAQALLENVADACAFLALTKDEPPSVVAHPSEGLSTAELLRLLGGRDPHLVPVTVARATAGAARLSARMSPRAAANARRLEMLWLGQEQAASWLTDAGWTPVAGKGRWAQIGHLLGQADASEDDR